MYIVSYKTPLRTTPPRRPRATPPSPRSWTRAECSTARVKGFWVGSTLPRCVASCRPKPTSCSTRQLWGWLSQDCAASSLNCASRHMLRWVAVLVWCSPLLHQLDLVPSTFHQSFIPTSVVYFHVLGLCFKMWSVFVRNSLISSSVHSYNCPSIFWSFVLFLNTVPIFFSKLVTFSTS